MECVFKKLLMELQTDERKEFLLWRSGKLMFVHLRRWNLCSAHRLSLFCQSNVGLTAWDYLVFGKSSDIWSRHECGMIFIYPADLQMLAGRHDFTLTMAGERIPK